MDPANFDAYGGLAHTEYCFQVREIYGTVGASYLSNFSMHWDTLLQVLLYCHIVSIIYAACVILAFHICGCMHECVQGSP